MLRCIKSLYGKFLVGETKKRKPQILATNALVAALVSKRAFHSSCPDSSRLPFTRPASLAPPPAAILASPVSKLPSPPFPPPQVPTCLLSCVSLQTLSFSAGPHLHTSPQRTPQKPDTTSCMGLPHLCFLSLVGGIPSLIFRSSVSCSFHALRDSWFKDSFNQQCLPATATRFHHAYSLSCSSSG